MKVNKQVFEYNNKVVIEKALIQPPHTQETVFQNGGCFLYMKNTDAEVFSSKDHLKISQKEAVLLKCDTYFIDFIQRSKDNSQAIELIAIHLYPDILKKIYINELPAMIEKQQHTGTKRVVDDIVLSKFIESLEFYFDNPTLVNDDLLELKIKELILLLVQTKNVNSISELISDLYSTRVSNLKSVVDLHLYSNLSMEQLAKLTNMSMSSFKREFKKVYNDSPANHINKEKIKKAKELLAVTDLPINEIAYEVGYNDPLYFTRLFKKKEGSSPSTYRSINSLN